LSPTSENQLLNFARERADKATHVSAENRKKGKKNKTKQK
jgi:hypothetical protein